MSFGSVVDYSAVIKIQTCFVLCCKNSNSRVRGWFQTDLKSGPASGQKQEKSGTSFTDESSDD